MRKKYLLSLVAILLFTSFSCNLLTGPGNNLQPGRRDYTWTVDTIRIFSNYIQEIWGSNPNDIWGVGPGGDLSTTIWHYDGKQWSTDGVGRNLSPESVFGFAKNDVWIGGEDGKIWHYDGSNWKQNYQHTINSFTNIGFYDLYGTSNHDFYAVGTVWFDNETRRGIILHYDGSSWKQEYLANSNSYFVKVRVSQDGTRYIYSIKQDVQYNSNDTTVFYEFDGKNLKQIYSDEDKTIKQGWVSIIDGNPYFSLANVIYRYQQNQFEELFKANSQFYTPSIFGRSEKDIFLGTSEGIEQYNGTDVQLLLTDASFVNGGQLFDKEVFFLNTTLRNGISLIYHGKLK